jgi:hypothetical protein
VERLSSVINQVQSILVIVMTPIPLVARFTIPLIDYQSSRHSEPLVFRQWLPLRAQDSLHAKEGQFDLRFWINGECVDHVLITELERYPEIPIRKLHVDLSGAQVSTSLADAITRLSSEVDWAPQHIDSTYDLGLLGGYRTLGMHLYLAAVKHFNRLAAYVRAMKGQYWLHEYVADVENLSSEFTKLGARVKLGEGEWIRLSSPGMLVFRLPAFERKRLIDQNDWEALREHLAGERKAPLVGQLLAGADEFYELGHRRAALIESVSALEVAITHYARRPNPECWSEVFGRRSNAAHLNTHIEHLGLTCTVGYLFPVIFSEEQIPGTILRDCHEAIIERNTVVHRGQRDIDDEKLKKYLTSIRELCDKLHQFADE